MCGRYILQSPVDAITGLFSVDQTVVAHEPRYNIAPTQEVPVVRYNQGLEVAHCRWGLVPAWASPEKRLPTLINARSETVHEKPSFRSAFQARRCVVLADGFYEWQRAGKERLPWYFQRTGGAGFGLAGIWERWHNEGQALESVSILTTHANPMVGRIHERMPVMLVDNALQAWLNPGADRAELSVCMTPFPEAGMRERRVGVAVNKAVAEGSALLAPVS